MIKRTYKIKCTLHYKTIYLKRSKIKRIITIAKQNCLYFVLTGLRYGERDSIPF